MSQPFDDTPRVPAPGSSAQAPRVEHGSPEASGRPPSPARLAEALDADLAASDRPAEVDPARRVERHHQAARAWEDLGRIDRALDHWLQAWRLAPDHTEALTAARRLYASVGDHDHVAAMYRAELERVPVQAPASQRIELWLALGETERRRGDRAAAIAALETAAAIDPAAPRPRQALAELYARPFAAADLPRDEDIDKASEIFVSLGAAAIAGGDLERGLGFLRRAVGLTPTSAPAADALERALTDAERWDELARVLDQRGEWLDDDAQRAEILARKVELLQRHAADPAALVATLGELTRYQPPRGPASRALRELLTSQARWAELAALLERDLDGLPDDDPGLIDQVLELAALYRDRLDDKDRAAELVHVALSLEPFHAEALARYADHFRERRDFRGLVDLHEFYLDRADAIGASLSERVARLEEIAQTRELRLGDVPGALEAWRRVAALAPDDLKVREAVRRLTTRAAIWEQLVAAMDGELRAVGGSPIPGGDTPPSAAVSPPAPPAEAVDTWFRVAQTFRERHVEPRRAIALYEQVILHRPDHLAALKGLIELYEREGDELGLARTLRRQLELEAGAEDGPGGGPGSPRSERPVEKRMERLATLRRLGTMCEQRLADAEGALYAYRGVLAILPSDRDALEHVERLLELLGDLDAVEHFLDTRAGTALAPAERLRVLRRLATLATARNAPERALERWRQLLALAPADEPALLALAELHERFQQFGDVAQVLERLLAVRYPRGGDAPLPGTAAAAALIRDRLRYARVVDDRLGDVPRAIAAWEQVRAATPRDRGVLEALARLYRSAGRDRELAEILAVEIEVFAADDAPRAVEVARERATVLADRLNAPGEAIAQLRRVITEIAPTDLGTHAVLRRLALDCGDVATAVLVAERELYLEPAPATKLAHALALGELCRDRLSDPARALQAYQRALVIDPHHDGALATAADLYQELGMFAEAARTLDRAIARTESPRAKKALLDRLAAITADHLGDARAAFHQWRQAHRAAGDHASLAQLQRFGEVHHLWRELVELWSEQRDLARPGQILADPAAYVHASRELARLFQHRLDDPAAAIAALRDAIAASPRDEELLGDAEQVAGAADQVAIWTQLLAGYDLALRAAAPAARVELHQRKAKVLDERLANPTAAAAEWLAGFAWAPDSEPIRRGLYQLAARSGTWSQVIAVETALAHRADGRERIAALRRRAAVMEEHLHDLPRAFRSHLVALLLAPDDTETVAHLWRIAGAVGRYQATDRLPKPEPVPAVIHDHPPPGGAGPARPSLPGAGGPRPERSISRGETAPGLRGAPIPTAPPRRDTTQPIELTDLVTDAEGRPVGPPPGAVGMGAAPPANPGAATMAPRPSGLVIESSRPPRNDPTMELQPRDLVAWTGSRNAAPPLPNHLPGMSARAKLPPPPPRAPRLDRPAPPLGPRKAQVSVRRPPLPTLPTRAFESPWEELATAYQTLPAPDRATRLRWLYRAAETWENGARELAPAFSILASALRTAGPDAALVTDARHHLHRFADDHGRWSELAELYESLVETAVTVDAAATMLLETGAIRQRQGDTDAAEAIYRRVLGMRPGDPLAVGPLETIYRATARWTELAASLEARTDPRLGATTSDIERPARLRELADIYAQHLGHPHDAIDSLEMLRPLVPHDLHVLGDLAKLYARVGGWLKAFEAVAQIGERPDPEAREVTRSIAVYYEAELGQPDRAATAYQRLLSRWPDDLDARSSLERLRRTEPEGGPSASP